MDDVIIPPAGGAQSPLEILARLLDELPFPTNRAALSTQLGGVLLPTSPRADRTIPAASLFSRIPDRTYRSAADAMAAVRIAARPLLEDERRSEPKGRSEPVRR